MKSTHSLYDTLMPLFGQSSWRDLRHLKTAVWMVIGLIETGLISLTEWTPFADTRAEYAQSTVRRFRRWLGNEKIDVNALYAPIIGSALVEWSDQTLYLALDTSLLWDKFCLIRVALVYRGRAVPLAWQVLEHGSATVAFDQYRLLLDRVQQLLPLHSRVVLLADRGFANIGLMAYCDEWLGWEWRIRCKSNYIVYRPGKRRTQVGRLQLKVGQARCLHGVRLTEQRYGPVHLALGFALDGKEKWFVVSSQPTSRTTFAEYGLRFDIEESFLDDKSNAFQVEHSRLRTAAVLQRLFFLLAITTLFLVAQGTHVVETQQRPLVDAHWWRGSSYLKIGWRWVRRAAVRGFALIHRLHLSPLPDLEPCFTSKSDVDKRLWQLEVSYDKYGIFAT